MAAGAHRRDRISVKRSLALAFCLAMLAGACSSARDQQAQGSPTPTPTLTPTPTPSPTQRLSPSSEPFVFAVKGDWGAGTPEQVALTQQMCEQRQRTPFSIVVTTGDNFYAPDGTATKRNYRDPERCLYEAPGHRWRASWGNHDHDGDATGTVLGASRYYTWSRSGVDFFALDSQNAGDPKQRQWLVRKLRASDATIKIAYFHHPGLTVGGHADNSAVRANWISLFSLYDVTLVLNGHNHDYEHLVADGVHYVVTGGGGRYLTPCLGRRPELVRCRVDHHFLLVTITGDEIEVRAITESGAALDRFTIRT